MFQNIRRSGGVTALVAATLLLGTPLTTAAAPRGAGPARAGRASVSRGAYVGRGYAGAYRGYAGYRPYYGYRSYSGYWYPGYRFYGYYPLFSYPYYGSYYYPYGYYSTYGGPTYYESPVTSYIPPTTDYAETSPPSGVSPEEVPATAALVTVRVPEGAQVWIGGKLTTLTGSVRTFQSPPLEPGRAYAYEIRARWLANGGTVTQSRKIDLFAGDRVTIAFPLAAERR